jgi:hypothetical protein
VAEKNSWYLKFIGYDMGWEQPWGNKLRFEITSPDHKTIFTTVYFTTLFVDDYFHIPGNSNRWLERRQEIKKNKLELFKKWALVKIEEALRNNTVGDKVEIFTKDFEWAEKIEKGYLKPLSQQQNDNTYVYNVERKIGF